MANNNNTKNLNVPNLRFPEFSGEWKKKHLSELVGDIKDRISTSSLSVDNYVSTENILQNFQGVTLATSLPHNTNVTAFRKDDILFSNIRPYLKKIWYASYDGGCSTDVFVFRNSGMCSAMFLYHLIANDKFINYVMLGTKGTKMPRGDKQQIIQYVVYLPSKLEQNKIATFLSLLDSRIEAQIKIIEKYESLIKGINEKLLINKKEYTTYRLSDICEIRSGYSGTQLTGTQGLMVSRIETISKHCINLDKVGYVKPFDSSADFKLHIGDILFSNINSVQYIGNTAFVDREYDLYHGMNLLRLIPRKIVEPFYVFLLLNTAKYKIHFQSICNKAISQASINQTELGKTVIHIPDLLYQKQICQLYNSLYNKKNIENLYLQALKQQKNHLLRQMVI
ncbi:restriction endonuclease subunit S [Bacteroides xylanisolvens]|uniref:Restriction endonuclease subunit S n=1 Tax=Bacteroides xylanisolvens TaxID=371601 RepID=A0A6L4NCQ1_9BACE|nr:restriction endonuclease subunit S [Bacteroides xylanisolvens]KAB6080549.1 restriction endonuclease subunit S [Bacteroides xylanisolvens]